MSFLITKSDLITLWILALCGEVFTISGLLYASSDIFLIMFTNSSMSDFEYDSHGSGVNGWGITHGWWLGK